MKTILFSFYFIVLASDSLEIITLARNKASVLGIAYYEGNQESRGSFFYLDKDYGEFFPMYPFNRRVEIYLNLDKKLWIEKYELSKYDINRLQYFLATSNNSVIFTAFAKGYRGYYIQENNLYLFSYQYKFANDKKGKDFVLYLNELFDDPSDLR